MNLGSPISTGGEIEPWIQAPSPIASATRKTFWISKSASIWVRIDQMVPSGSLMSLLRKPFLTHFLAPADW